MAGMLGFPYLSFTSVSNGGASQYPYQWGYGVGDPNLHAAAAYAQAAAASYLAQPPLPPLPPPMPVQLPQHYEATSYVHASQPSYSLAPMSMSTMGSMSGYATTPYSPFSAAAANAAAAAAGYYSMPPPPPPAAPVFNPYVPFPMASAHPSAQRTPEPSFFAKRRAAAYRDTGGNEHTRGRGKPSTTTAAMLAATTASMQITAAMMRTPFSDGGGDAGSHARPIVLSGDDDEEDKADHQSDASSVSSPSGHGRSSYRPPSPGSRMLQDVEQLLRDHRRERANEQALIAASARAQARAVAAARAEKSKNAPPLPLPPPPQQQPQHPTTTLMLPRAHPPLLPQLQSPSTLSFAASAPPPRHSSPASSGSGGVPPRIMTSDRPPPPKRSHTAKPPSEGALLAAAVGAAHEAAMLVALAARGSPPPPRSQAHLHSAVEHYRAASPPDENEQAIAIAKDEVRRERNRVRLIARHAEQERTAELKRRRLAERAAARAHAKQQQEELLHASQNGVAHAADGTDDPAMALVLANEPQSPATPMSESSDDSDASALTTPPQTPRALRSRGGPTAAAASSTRLRATVAMHDHAPSESEADQQSDADGDQRMRDAPQHDTDDDEATDLASSSLPLEMPAWLKSFCAPASSIAAAAAPDEERIAWQDALRYRSKFDGEPENVPSLTGDVLGVGVNFGGSVTVTPTSNTAPPKPKPARKALTVTVAKDALSALRTFKTQLATLLPDRVAANRATVRANAEAQQAAVRARMQVAPFSSITRARASDLKHAKGHGHQRGGDARHAHVAHDTHGAERPKGTAVIEQVVLRELSRSFAFPVTLGAADGVAGVGNGGGRSFFSTRRPVPERTHYTSVRRNIPAADDRRLRFVPYFGDEEGELLDASMYLGPEHAEEPQEALETDACLLKVAEKHGDREDVFATVAQALNDHKAEREARARQRARPKKRRKKQAPPPQQAAERASSRNGGGGGGGREDEEEEKDIVAIDSGSDSSRDSSPSPPSSPRLSTSSLRARWHTLSMADDRRASAQLMRLEAFGSDHDLVATLHARKQEVRVKIEVGAEEAKQADADPSASASVSPSAPLSSKPSILSSFQTHFCRRCFVYDCRAHGRSQPRPTDRRMPLHEELASPQRLGLQGAILGPQPAAIPRSPAPTTPRQRLAAARATPVPELSFPVIAIAPSTSASSSSVSTEPCGSHCHKLLLAASSGSAVTACTDVACSMPSLLAAARHAHDGMAHAHFHEQWSEMEQLLLRQLVYVFGPAGSSTITTTTTTDPASSSSAGTTLPSIYSFPFCALANALGSKSCSEVFVFIERTTRSGSGAFLTRASRAAQEAEAARRSQGPEEAEASTSHRGGKKKRKRAGPGTRAALALRLKAAFRRSLRQLPHAHVACDHPGLSCADAGEACACTRNLQFCERYCACAGDCANRFRGCTCASSRGAGRCHTRACPCFAANRECDADLCGQCDLDAAVDGHGHSHGEPCSNAALQAGRRQPLLLAESDVHGWGCFLSSTELGGGSALATSASSSARVTASRALRKHDLITEYFGELISQDEADRRGRIYDRLNRSYLFNLNVESCVDAARKGNKIKFANHSPSANCYSKVVQVRGAHRIGIYAAKPIRPGDELCFDYQHEHSGTAPLWFMEKNGAASGAPQSHAARKTTNTAAAAAAGNARAER